MRFDELRTRYNEPAGYRALLAIALPMLVSMGAYSIMQLCDRVFLSWCSPEEMAASVPASSLVLVLSCVFFGTALYTSTFVAQYHGAGRSDRVGAALWAGLIVAFCGQVFVALAALGAEPLFVLVGHAPEVRVHEVSYFRISSLGVGAMIGSGVLGSFYSARGQTRPAMWISCGAALLNIPLGYALVFGRFGAPRLGMNGAALATVLAQWAGFFTWASLVFRRKHDDAFRVFRDAGIDRAQLLRLLRFGLPNGAHFFLDGFAWTLFSLIVGRLGVVQLAASNIAWQLNSVALLPVLGIGASASILVAQSQGAGRPELAERAARSGVHMALVYASVLGALLVVVPELFILPFAARAGAEFEAVSGLAEHLLGFVALLGLCHAVQMTYASVLKGAGDVRFIMATLAISSTLGFIGPCIALAAVGAGLRGLWLWFIAYASVMAYVFRARFLSGRWRAMRVVEVEAVETPSAAAP